MPITLILLNVVSRDDIDANLQQWAMTIIQLIFGFISIIDD
jgi:hypothetical protein